MLDDNELPSDNPTLHVQFPLHTSIITVDIAIFRGALYLYLLGVKIRFNSPNGPKSSQFLLGKPHLDVCYAIFKAPRPY